MSHTTVAIPAIAPGVMSALIPAAVMGSAGFLLTTGAVLAARKLREDFGQAKCEMEEISRTRDAAYQNKLALSADKQRLASIMGATIEAHEGSNSTETFLAAAIESVIKRAESEEIVEIKTRARELQKAPIADSHKVLAAYFELNDLLDQQLAEKRRDGAQEQALAGMVESVRLEIESPIFADPRFEAVGRQLMEQFASIEKIDGANHKLKLQGLENLKTRVRREISDSAAKEAALRAENLRRREIMAETVAMLRAVSNAPGSPEESGQALTLLTEIGEAFKAGAPPRISDLEAILSKAKALFEICKKRLDAAATSAYMAESVKEALLRMGYHVSELPAEGEAAGTGCMVSLNNDTGVVFDVEGNGQLHSEMVAFDASASQPDPEAEESVCRLIDQIHAALNQKGIPIREKTRRHLKAGHTIPVVKRPKREQFVAKATELKARAIE